MKKLNKIFTCILVLFGMYYVIKYSINFDLTKILTSLCVPILVVLPKVIKLKLNDKLVFIYYLYIFILMILGSLARFYAIFKYYDVFAHFMFGFLASIIGLYLLNMFKMNKKSITFNIIFIISITLALASLWETFEYIASIISKKDVQDVLKTGVSDTMEDIIAALISSIIFIVIYVFKREKLDNLIECQK